MDNHVIVAVHDRQLDAFMRPFTAQTIGQAMRSFRDEVNRQGSEMNSHPEDYALYKVGEWDEQYGRVIPLKEGAEQLALATNVLEQPRRPVTRAEEEHRAFNRSDN